MLKTKYGEDHGDGMSTDEGRGIISNRNLSRVIQDGLHSVGDDFDHDGDNSMYSPSIISALTEIQSFLDRQEEQDVAHPTLFGRERNQESLEAALDRLLMSNSNQSKYTTINTNTSSELVVITGRSGCGKTALAESMRLHAVRRNAHFAQGKFNQFTWSNLPYSAIITAMTELIDSFLDREEELEEIRSTIRTTMGDNVFILTPLVPNLAQLAGVCGLESTATNGLEYAFDRVKQSFCELLNALATPLHPIVMVLDDLQYSDAASLDILRAILSDSNTHHVLMIVTSRHSEDTTLLQTVATRKALMRTTEMELTNLRESDAYYVTASLLKEDSSSIYDLSDICYSKTNGNPFFLKQFIALLQKKELLISKTQGGVRKWDWDPGLVRDEASRSGIVLEVTFELIVLLHPLIQHFLQIAACVGADVCIMEIIFDAMRHQKSTTTAIHEILQVAASMGHQFQQMTTELIYGAVEQQISLGTIDESTETTPSEEYGVSVPNLPSIQVAVCLACATKMELLKSDGDERFVFSHDGVQQAVCESLGDSRADKHLAIGHILRQHENFNPGNPPFFFLVVDQLNAGSMRIASDDSLISLISLNIEAAVVATEHSAFMSAQRYLRQALCLQPNFVMWEDEYELMLECSILAADMDMACGNYEEAISHVDQVFRHAQSLQDRHPAVCTKIASLIAIGRIEGARDVTLAAVLELDCKFPTKPKKLHLKDEMLRTGEKLAKRTDAQLLGLQPIVMAAQITLVKLLRQLSWCSFCLGDGEMLCVTAFRMVQLTMAYGFSDSAPLAFAMCGLIHSYYKNFKEVPRFGHLCARGLEQVNDTHIKARTLYVLWSFCKHWDTSLAGIHAGLVHASELATSSGDADLAMKCMLNTYISSFLQGRERLDVVIGSIRSVYTAHVNHEDTDCSFCRIVLQTTANLKDQSRVPYKLTGEFMAEEIMLHDAVEKQHHMVQFALLHAKLQLCAFFNQWEMAEEIVERIGDNHKCLRPHFSHLHYWMLFALTHAIRFNDTKKRKHRRATKLAIKEMNAMVDGGVTACESMFALLLAEESASGGDQNVAIAAFDFAARSFGSQHSFNYQALANERAARNMIRFFPRDAVAAETYLQKARTCYKAWGANCKVAMLDEEIAERWDVKVPRKQSGI